MDLNTTTLKVKNIPNFILKDKKKTEELFKQFSGVDIRTFYNSTQYNGYAYVNFPNRELASLASVRIQQLSFEPNKYLSVEFAIPDQEKINKNQSIFFGKIPTSENNLILNNSNNNFNEIPNYKVIEQNETPSSIAPELGIDYPSMPTLKYQYPPPNPDIIINIMNAIVAVPKLYIQVIHLMNKMNLPPPFGEATNMTPMLYNYFYKNKTEELKKRKKRETLLSSDESELESDDDKKIEFLKKGNIVLNDQITTTSHINKKPKIMTNQNEIQIKINLDNKLTEKNKNEIVDRNEIPSKPLILTNNDIPSNPPILTNNDIVNYEPNEHCISLDELNKMKISQEEMEKLPAYRNYKEGVPSRTLFLKNINVKLTKEKDLEHIFGRYLRDEEMSEKLNIRLMVSGRMKGQAFVKLPTVEMATLLLKEVHGYILNDKAIIIQYGKSND
ncbi:hypothetical protein BCR36DRAFT_587560 [Piromyces finnis]|uniref:RRM domain-containing protein n=1 Tax=Piromyces finnis TaxID=1754191 RepID=A0A1Y1UWV1_9FUNG|nr:hypothetical protein BCR36DRAFT_587560 [Piromyces finnis]|eukprot:ORX41981.1 hypothetical protein BCR36DRAFT_587560 [Piromyces finnis]